MSSNSQELPQEIVAELQAYEQQALQMSGWKLEYAPTELGAGPNWHYEDLVLKCMTSQVTGQPHAQAVKSMLDIGTGGGEVYKSLIDQCASTIEFFATEEYVVNAPLAATLLTQYPVHVVRASGEVLPYGAESFDLVCSRHTAIAPKEIQRVLAPGATFITQQVAFDSLIELKAFFDDFTVFPNHFALYSEGLAEAGLTIVRAEQYKTKSRFQSFGHLVYMLAVAPWLVPGFSVSTHARPLAKLYEATDSGRNLEFTSGYHLICARKD